jgi:hypothetical protein
VGLGYKNKGGERKEDHEKIMAERRRHWWKRKIGKLPNWKIESVWKILESRKRKRREN